jgi:hypothetical protein
VTHRPRRLSQAERRAAARYCSLRSLPSQTIETQFHSIVYAYMNIAFSPTQSAPTAHELRPSILALTKEHTVKHNISRRSGRELLAKFTHLRVIRALRFACVARRARCRARIPLATALAVRRLRGAARRPGARRGACRRRARGHFRHRGRLRRRVPRRGRRPRRGGDRWHRRAVRRRARDRVRRQRLVDVDQDSGVLRYGMCVRNGLVMKEEKRWVAHPSRHRGS